MLTRRPSRDRASSSTKKGDTNRADWIWSHTHWTKLKHTHTHSHKEKDKDVPKCRSGHACVQIGHYMYIIGGYSDGICFSDVYILDLNSHAWRHVENSGTVVQGTYVDIIKYLHIHIDTHTHTYTHSLYRLCDLSISISYTYIHTHISIQAAPPTAAAWAPRSVTFTCLVGRVLVGGGRIWATWPSLTRRRRSGPSCL
jgi:hypothetical protein